jgi:hypothetical protein
MLVIEATRRVSRAPVARIREAFIEFDRAAFKDVYIKPEEAYKVVKDGRTYVLACTDPTIEKRVSE